MATFDDLVPCTYLPVQAPNLLAVGWLGRDSKFERGEVSPTFFERLRDFAAVAWQPFICAGVHFCELCQYDPPGFNGHLFVPHKGVVYVAPEGIVHYVAVHWYRPPPPFVAAVLECPPMNSMDYKKALLANGGRVLVKAMRA